jgi:hypothetical protein
VIPGGRAEIQQGVTMASQIWNNAHQSPTQQHFHSSQSISFGDRVLSRAHSHAGDTKYINKKKQARTFIHILASAALLLSQLQLFIMLKSPISKGRRQPHYFSPDEKDVRARVKK